MSKEDKLFTRREAVWVGILGLLQLGVLSSAAAGWWNPRPGDGLPRIFFTRPGEAPKSEDPAQGQNVLKIAVASVISPMENINLYTDLLNQIGLMTNMKVLMVQEENYTETNRLVENGDVQMAFICSGALLGKNGREEMEIIATPQIAGSATYRSYIIVPASSQAGAIADLKGKQFAYMDPLSFSGRIAPQVMIKRLGHKPETFFARTMYTYSHDKSIRAVADGIVDGAAVDSLIYDLTLAKSPEMMGKVKVIDQSEEAGNPPVVVSKHTDPELAAMLKNVLLTLHMDEDGRKAMKLLQFDRFVHPDHALYDKIAAMAREVGIE